MSSTSKRNQAELSKRKALREVKFDAAGTAKVDIADEFYDSMLDNNKDKDDVPGSFTSDVTMDQDLLDILKFIQPKGWEHLSKNESKRAKSFKLQERHKKYFVKSNYLYNDSSLLIIAVKCQNYLAVKRIVDFCHEEGITANNEDIIDGRDNIGNTALHIAAELGLTSMVELLVDCGASLLAQNSHGMYPLHLAVEANNVSTVKRLIDLAGERLVLETCNAEGEVLKDFKSKYFYLDPNTAVIPTLRKSDNYTLCNPSDKVVAKRKGTSPLMTYRNEKMKLFLAKNKQVRARGIKLKVEEYHIQGKGNASAFKMNNGDELGKVDGLNIIKNTLGKYEYEFEVLWEYPRADLISFLDKQPNSKGGEEDLKQYFSDVFEGEILEDNEDAGSDSDDHNVNKNDQKEKKIRFSTFNTDIEISSYFGDTLHERVVDALHKIKLFIKEHVTDSTAKLRMRKVMTRRYITDTRAIYEVDCNNPYLLPTKHKRQTIIGFHAIEGDGESLIDAFDDRCDTVCRHYWNARNQYSKSSFISACEFDKLGVVEHALSIRKWAKDPLLSTSMVDSANAKGVTCLMYAVTTGNAKLVQLLLSNDANPLARTIWGDTALLWSVEKKYPDSVKIVHLILNQVKEDEAAKVMTKAAAARAVSNSQRSSSQSSAPPGMNRNTNGSFNGGNQLGNLYEDDVDIDIDEDLITFSQKSKLESLLNGTDSSGKVPDQLTNPLMRAASHGNHEIVKILLENGADLFKDGADTFQQKKFRTAADYAYEHKNYEIAFLLDTQSTRRRLRFDFRRKCRATAEVMVLDFDNQIDSSGLVLNVFKTSDTSMNELMPLEDSESDISHNVKEKELYESNRVKPMTGKALNVQPFRKDMEKLDDKAMYLSFHEDNYKGQSAKAHRPTESSRLPSMVNEGHEVWQMLPRPEVWHYKPKNISNKLLGMCIIALVSTLLLPHNNEIGYIVKLKRDHSAEDIARNTFDYYLQRLEEFRHIAKLAAYDFETFQNFCYILSNAHLDSLTTFKSVLQSFFQGCYEQQEFDKELIQRLMMLIKALDQAANNNGRIRKQVDDEVERLETIITRIFNQKGMTDEDNVYELVTLTKSSETYKNPIVRRAASFYDPVIKTAIDLDITSLFGVGQISTMTESILKGNLMGDHLASDVVVKSHKKDAKKSTSTSTGTPTLETNTTESVASGTENDDTDSESDDDMLAFSRSRRRSSLLKAVSKGLAHTLPGGTGLDTREEADSNRVGLADDNRMETLPVHIKDFGRMLNILMTHKAAKQFRNIRFSPIIMFFMEGASKLLYLILIGYVSAMQYGELYEDKVDSGPADPKWEPTRWTNLEYYVLIMLCAYLLSELGEFEGNTMEISDGSSDDKSFTVVRIYNNFVDNFFHNEWNFLDFLVIILTIAWAICHDSVATVHNGRAFLASAAIPASLAMLRYFAIEKEMGNLVITCISMGKDLLAFVMVYLVSIFGFGVALRSLFQHDHLWYDQDGDGSPDGTSLTSGFSTLTSTSLTLFDATLGNYGFDLIDPESPYRVLGTILIIIFLILTTIILLNLLIAKMSSTYAAREEKALQEWEFQRAQVVKQFALVGEASPLCMLPAPLNLLSSALYFFHYAWINYHMHGRMFYTMGETKKNERKGKHKKEVTSIAGTVSDWLLGTLSGFVMCTLEVIFDVEEIVVDFSHQWATDHTNEHMKYLYDKGETNNYPYGYAFKRFSMSAGWTISMVAHVILYVLVSPLIWCYYNYEHLKEVFSHSVKLQFECADNDNLCILYPKMNAADLKHEPKDDLQVNYMHGKVIRGQITQLQHRFEENYIAVRFICSPFRVQTGYATTETKPPDRITVTDRKGQRPKPLDVHKMVITAFENSKLTMPLFPYNNGYDGIGGTLMPSLQVQVVELGVTERLLASGELSGEQLRTAIMNGRFEGNIYLKCEHKESKFWLSKSMSEFHRIDSQYVNDTIVSEKNKSLKKDEDKLPLYKDDLQDFKHVEFNQKKMLKECQRREAGKVDKPKDSTERMKEEVGQEVRGKIIGYLQVALYFKFSDFKETVSRSIDRFQRDSWKPNTNDSKNKPFSMRNTNAINKVVPENRQSLSASSQYDGEDYSLYDDAHMKQKEYVDMRLASSNDLDIRNDHYDAPPDSGAPMKARRASDMDVSSDALREKSTALGTFKKAKSEAVLNLDEDDYDDAALSQSMSGAHTTQTAADRRDGKSVAAEAFNRFDKEWIEFRRPLKLLNASEKEDIFKDYLDGAISAESSGNTKATEEELLQLNRTAVADMQLMAQNVRRKSIIHHEINRSSVSST